MYQPPCFDAMNPGITIYGRGVIELQDEGAIAQLHTGALRRVGELGSLPGLSLVLAQILHNKRPHVVNREQPFASGMDGEAPQVAGNPPSSQFLGHCGCCATPAKAVENKITWIR